MYYSPVRRLPTCMMPLDLHVLCLPLAFNLSHDQTLLLDLSFVFIIYENINKYSLLYYLLITQFFIIYASNYLFHILYFYFLQTITAFKNLHTLI